MIIEMIKHYGKTALGPNAVASVDKMKVRKQQVKDHQSARK